MTKESGLGDNFYIGGYDLSGDVSALGTGASRRALLDVTAINKSAYERISGLTDGEISFATWKDVTTNAEQDALEQLPATDRLAFYFHGAAVGNAAAMILGKQINYDWQRGQDGSLAGTVQVLGNGAPLEWGDQLTPGPQNFASATNGTSIDTGASLSFGAVAGLQVFSVGTGTAVPAIQDSADNISFANVTGLVFTGAAGRTQERLATGVTATVRRYLRLNVTGSFTNALIAVVVRKFDVAQS